MARTKVKGDVGVAMVIADVMKRGYKVALPMGEDWPYDLIVLRKKLERVQVKYTESKGVYVDVKCRSTNGWRTYKYTANHIDWIAVYDKTTDRCYYIPARLLGTGRASFWLRLTPTRNGRRKDVLFAKDFLRF